MPPTYGMRRDEIAGLGWSKINLELGHNYITQTISQMKNGPLILKSPKNDKPRKIALSESLLIEFRLFIQSVNQNVANCRTIGQTTIHMILVGSQNNGLIAIAAT